MDKRLLTIQDISCVGQCSLTVALPILSACGIETGILPSSVLSNHTAPGYSGWTFHDLTPEMPKILERWLKEKVDFDAFYTGYVSKDQIPYILDIMDKAARPNALRIVDPAMADNGKLYAGFADDFPKDMARLCKGADFILPNITEASLLLGETYKDKGYDKAYIENLCHGLYNLGAKNVILTGVSFSDDKLGVASFDGNSFEYYFNTRLDAAMHGTGDVYAATFTGAMLRGCSINDSARIAADFTVKSIENTHKDESHWYGVKFEGVLPNLIEMLEVTSKNT